MAGTFNRTFAGFAMRYPIARTDSILESSCAGASPDPATQFQFDQAVDFDRVLDGDPPRHDLGRPEDDHPEGLVLRHPARRHVEEHLVAHLADAPVLDDLRIRLVEFNRGDGLGPRLRIEHQRGPFDARFDTRGPRRHPHRGTQRSPTAAADDAAVHDPRSGPRGHVDHLRAYILVLTFPREGNPDEFRGGPGPEEIRPGNLPSAAGAPGPADPFYRGGPVDERALRHHVVHLAREVLQGDVPHLGSRHRDDLAG